MIRKVSIIGILLLILSAIVAMVAAQDNYNPKPFTPEDNACYEGGSMWRDASESDGCTTAWHWECGWYVARVEAVVYTEDDIPHWCRILVDDGQPLVETAAPVVDLLPRLTNCTYDGRPGTPYSIIIVTDWDIAFANQASIRFDVTSQLHGFQSETVIVGSGDSDIQHRFNFPTSPRPTVQVVTAHLLDSNSNEILAFDCPPLKS